MIKLDVDRLQNERFRVIIEGDRAELESWNLGDVLDEFEPKEDEESVSCMLGGCHVRR